jgi:hypothetical protein
MIDLDARFGSIASILACPRHVRFAGNLGSAGGRVRQFGHDSSVQAGDLNHAVSSHGLRSGCHSFRKAALHSPCWRFARKPVERFFSKIKQCRRIATHEDKLAANYLVFPQLSASGCALTSPRFGSDPLADLTRRANH